MRNITRCFGRLSGVEANGSLDPHRPAGRHGSRALRQMLFAERERDIRNGEMMCDSDERH